MNTLRRPATGWLPTQALVCDLDSGAVLDVAQGMYAALGALDSSRRCSRSLVSLPSFAGAAVADSLGGSRWVNANNKPPHGSRMGGAAGQPYTDRCRYGLLADELEAHRVLVRASECYRTGFVDV